MITVIERWHLLPELADRGLEVMQEMDDLVGPPAHDDPGWSGHARFFRRHDTSTELIMIYPWRSIEDHHKLRESEEPLLADFYAKYCAASREVSYYDELAVEVEHDDH